MWVGAIINIAVFLVSSACHRVGVLVEWMSEWKIDVIVGSGAKCRGTQQHGNMIKSVTIGKNFDRENEQMNVTYK